MEKVISVLKLLYECFFIVLLRLVFSIIGVQVPLLCLWFVFVRQPHLWGFKINILWHHSPQHLYMQRTLWRVIDF